MVYIKVLVTTMVVVLLVAGISPAGASDAFPDVGDVGSPGTGESIGALT